MLPARSRRATFRFVEVVQRSISGDQGVDFQQSRFVIALVLQVREATVGPTFQVPEVNNESGPA